MEAKKLEVDPQVDHKERTPHKNKIEKKTPATGLCVHLPNGDFIQESTAASTFVAAIDKAGLLPVRNLDINIIG